MVTVEVWQVGGVMAVAVVCINSSIGLCKWVMTRRNGSPGEKTLCRQHAERVAKLEVLQTTLANGQDKLSTKMDCIDQKVVRLLVQQGIEDAQG